MEKFEDLSIYSGKEMIYNARKVKSITYEKSGVQRKGNHHEAGICKIL